MKQKSILKKQESVIWDHQPFQDKEAPLVQTVVAEDPVPQVQIAALLQVRPAVVLHAVVLLVVVLQARPAVVLPAAVLLADVVDLLVVVLVVLLLMPLWILFMVDVV